MTHLDKALNYYRAGLEGRRPDYVPSRIRLASTVCSDFPIFSDQGRGYIAGAGEHDCESNRWGAVSVRAENGKLLGIKPSEFEVIAWTLNPNP